jgi:hypothetical protein
VNYNIKGCTACFRYGHTVLLCAKHREEYALETPPTKQEVHVGLLKLAEQAGGVIDHNSRGHPFMKVNPEVLAKLLGVMSDELGRLERERASNWSDCGIKTDNG